MNAKLGRNPNSRKWMKNTVACKWENKPSWMEPWKNPAHITVERIKRGQGSFIFMPMVLKGAPANNVFSQHS